MATMTMSLIGMYNADNTLFDQMVLPEELDRDLVISSLLMRSGEFEVMYPDIDFMKSFIGMWSHKWQRTFTEWLRGTKSTWNPIENYDRYEDITDTYDKTDSATTSETSSGSSSGTDGFTGGGSNEAQVSAYDASTYQPSAKNITSTSNSATSSSTTSATSSGSNSVTTDSTNIHSGHIHGNIGVTQASDMLRSFYDISAWNLYDHIADVFIAEACIPVY